MKRIIFVFVLVGALFTLQAQSTKTPPLEIHSLEIPEFNNPEVRKFVEDYTVFMNEYVKAAKAQDTERLSALAQEIEGWGDKAASITQILVRDPEDNEKFTEYFQALNLELMEDLQEMETDQELGTED